MTGAADTSKRALLMRLQEVDPDDVYPARPCGLDRRWLARDGTAYFEVRYPGERPDTDSEAVHFLATVMNGTPTRVCDATFTMHWRMVPPAQ
jgi:hypothetical protein